jgi:MFS family permease
MEVVEARGPGIDVGRRPVAATFGRPPEGPAGIPALACGQEAREAAVSPRSIFGPYARLFAVPGARAFSLAGWLGRVPMATVGLGSVLLVAGETGSYGLAGLVSGTLALSFALATPQWARVMDRVGQGPVLRWTAVASLVLGLAFVGVVVADAPLWTWFVLAVAAGGSGANVGSVVRSRWAHALPESAQRQTAFAFESVADEVVFVTMPPLVTFLAAAISPPAGFLTGLLVGVAGALWLSRQQATAPQVADRSAGQAPARVRVLGPGLLAIAITYAAIGLVFGSVDVVVVAFAEEEGHAAVAGLALACYAGGSLVAGLVYGVLRLPGTLTARFLGCALLFAAAAQTLHLVESLPMLIWLAFLAGLTIAPVLVAGMSLVESRVPRAALTEGLTWTTTGLTIGVTAGSALTGRAVDAWGAEAAFAVPAFGALAAGVLALGAWTVLRRPGPVAAPAAAGTDRAAA